MARQNGDFAFSNNFEVAKAAPLDARVTTPTYAQLTSLPFAYKGMLVSVTGDGSNNGVYRLTADDASVASNWARIDPVLATVASTGDYDDLSNLPSIDSALSSTSTNAVRNSVVHARFAGVDTAVTAAAVTDAALSATSTNPVQNQAVHTRFAGVDTAINSLATVASTGNYADLTGTPPTPFDGNYYSLSNRPDLPNTMRAAYLGRWRLFTGTITTATSVTNVTSQNILPQNDVRVSLRWSREDGAASSQAPTYMDDFQTQLARTKCVIKVEGLYTICYRLFTISGSRTNKSKAQSLILVEKPSMNGGTSQYTNGGVPKDHLIRHYGPMISYEQTHSVVAYGDTKTIHLGVGDQVYIQVEGLHNQDNSANRGAYANNSADESFVVFEFIYPGHV